MKPVFAIMVTYRRFDHFRQTVESLLPTLPAGSKLAIVYNREGKHADDFQYEGYMRKLTMEHDNVEVLDTGANQGWGASMNEGLSLYDWEEFDYVLESNNDVTYEPDWCAKAQGMMEAYPKIGVLGLWRHPHHGTLHEWGEVTVRDNAPATAWFFRSKDLARFLPFPEHGPTKTRGGNGEDVAMTHKIMDAGFYIAAPKQDLAHHMDGYDLPDLGKENPAYL